MTNKQEDWRGEFKKLVNEDYEYKLRDTGVQEKLETFIQNLLDTRTAQIVERIEGLKERCEECENHEIHDTPRNQIIDQAIEIVKDNK